MKKMPGRLPAFLALLILTSGLVMAVSATQDPPQKKYAYLPESLARKSAVTVEMPVYPKDAVQARRSGIVHVMLEIDAAGDVFQIKVKPGTDPTLSKAAVAAVKQWKFSWASSAGLARPILTRLIFRFTLTGGEAAVELYSPQPDDRVDECLSCTNTARELRAWREWPEAWRAESQS